MGIGHKNIDDKDMMLFVIIISCNVANTNVSEIIYFTLICCQITTDTKCICNTVSQYEFSQEWIKCLDIIH